MSSRYVSEYHRVEFDIHPICSSHVETVVKLFLKKDTPKIEVIMKPDEE